MIYFAYAPELNRVKIGFTEGDAKQRVDNLQVGSPVDLLLIGAINGEREQEKELQNQFSALWVRGEWYTLTDCLKQFITRHIPDAVWSMRSIEAQSWLTNLTEAEKSAIENQLRGLK